MARDAGLPMILVVAAGRRRLGASVTASLVALAAMHEGARVAWLDALAEGGPGTLPERVGRAGAYDLAVIDAGASAEAVHAAVALPGRRTLLLVTGDDRADLAAGYAVLKSAVSRADDLALAAAATRLAPDAARWACDVLAESCARFLGRPLLVAGALPDDPTLAAALAAGMPIGDAADGSPTAGAAAEVARALRAPQHPLSPASLPAGARRAASLPLDPSLPRRSPQVR